MTASAPIATQTSSSTGVEILKALRFKHPRVTYVMQETDTLIYPGSQDSILLVCGPSGVGKSTLAQHHRDTALKAAAASMEKDAGLVPAAYVEARSVGEEVFSWRSFYGNVLTEIDPQTSMPRTAFGIDPATGLFVRPHGRSNNTLAAQRASLERALRARGTQVLFVDEAAHIIQGVRGKRLEIQLNTIKSLANISGTQIVLVGSYDLYDLMMLSGQLARRTHVIHMERYREDRPEDVRAFRGCVKHFQDKLPEIFGNDLLPYSDSLLENSLGCIGALTAILTRSVRYARTDGKWSEDALQRALYNDSQRIRMLDDILEGEAKIAPSLVRSVPKTSTHSLLDVAA